MDLAVSRARCNNPSYYPFICPNRSWVLPFPTQGLQRWSCDCQGFTSRARCIADTFYFLPFQTDPPFPLLPASLTELMPTAKPGWNRSGSLQREPHISMGWQTDQQAGGDGSWKELADVGLGKLLLFSPAAPHGWAHPAHCIFEYHSGHGRAAREGGREAQVTRLAGCVAPYRHTELPIQAAGSPESVFL